MNKSKDVEELLGLFKPLGIKVSYNIERFYSDGGVKMVLHNLFLLLLREEGVSDDCRDELDTAWLLQSIAKIQRKGVRTSDSFR